MKFRKLDFDYLYITKNSEYGSTIVFKITKYLENKRIIIEKHLFCDYCDLDHIFNDINFEILFELKKKGIVLNEED